MAKTPSKIWISQLAAGVLWCAGSFAQTSTAPAVGSPPAALSNLKFYHVSLSVRDMDREIEWYSRVMGLKETMRLKRPNMLIATVRNANLRIDLIKYTGSMRTPADPVYMQQGWVHLALTVPNTASALAVLKALNADVKGTGVLTLRDPEGNEIEIFPLAPPVAQK